MMSDHQSESGSFMQCSGQQYMSHISPDFPGYQSASVGPGVHRQFSSQALHQSFDQMMHPAYRQQHQVSGYPQQQYTSHGLPGAINTPSTSQQMHPGQMQGTQLIGQSNMHPSHPHMRNTGQNPQEVANNILHMASSSYPSNNTVQVPLSKNRSAPYHVPARPSNYGGQMVDNQQIMCGDFGQNRFMYPSPPHPSQQFQQGVRDPRMSPVSPSQGSAISSPHGYPRERNISGSGSCSMSSPVMGSVHSPGPYSQMSNSPQLGQFPVSSPVGTTNIRMPSPVSTSQQQPVSVPSSVPQSFHQQCYGPNMANTSPYRPSNFQPASQCSPGSMHRTQQSCSFSQSPSRQGGQYGQPLNVPSGQFCQSPGGQSSQYGQSPIGNSGYVQSPSGCSVQYGQSPSSQSSQFCQSPVGPISQYSHSPGGLSNTSCQSPGGQFRQSPSANSGQVCPSPSANSGHMSNISSPYTPGSVNYHSPTQMQRSVLDTDSSATNCSNQCAASPLQSLQRLCMLPDSKVTDPKSVVKEACVPSPASCCSSPQQTAADMPKTKRNLTSTNQNQFHSQEDGNRTPKNEAVTCVSSSEMKCQPKKMMLLRAAKDDFTSSSVQRETFTTLQHQFEGNNSERDRSDGSSNNNCELKNSSANPAGHKCQDTEKGQKEDSGAISVMDKKARNDGDSKSNIQHNIKQVCVPDSTEEDKVADGKNVEDIETESKLEKNNPDSENCDTDSDAFPMENVKSLDKSSGDVQEETITMEVISDSESQQNEETCTYTKHDTGKLKSFDISSRKRADSTGSHSLSSEFEYEDHIGCDDIETGFSDIDDKDNEVVEESSDDTRHENNAGPKRRTVLDRVVIVGSNNKLGIKKKQAVQLKTVHKRQLSSGRVLRRKSDIDSDSEIPSPYGFDMVDGLEEPVTVDNGDGTVAVRQGRVRQRKMPVKYKDTSFFQGDFVFVEEENELLETHEPRKKIQKREIKKDKTSVPAAPKMQNGEKGVKSGNVKISESETKTVIKSSSDEDKKNKILAASKNLKETLQLLAKQTEKSRPEKKQISKILIISKDKSVLIDAKGASKTVETLSNTAKHLDEGVQEEEHDDGVTSCSKVLKPSSVATRKKNKSKESKNRTTGMSTEESSVQKNGSIHTKKVAKQLNHVTSASLNKGKDSNKSEVKRGVPKKSRKKTLRSESKVEKTDVKEKEQEKYEVIEIDSDDNDGANKIDDAKIEMKPVCSPNHQTGHTGSLDLECDEIDQDNAKASSGYMFAFVEDDMIDEQVTNENNDTSVKLDSTELEEIQCIVSKTQSRKSANQNTGSSSKCKSKFQLTKNSRHKAANKKRQNVFVDDDPDFELGPNKKPFKSLNLEKTSDSSKNKKKRDKWADFKGPKIVYEGVKETPQGCVVINDPYDQTNSKKAKLVAQNVTRIEISQLPSDKSVVVPNTETVDTDKWVCALCGKHSAFKFLGDLFGPYTVETMSEDMLDLSPTVRLGSAKKRKSEEGQCGSGKGGKAGSRAASVTREVNEWKEVWVHESCSVFSDGVFLLGTKIYGLQEAVRIASKTPCSHCHEMGAMIGCLNKGCQQKYHHACAEEAECYLDEENFSLLCPKHKVKKLKQLEAEAGSSSCI